MLLKILTKIPAGRKKLRLNPYHCAHRIHIFCNWGGRTNLIFLLYSSPLRPVLRWAAISALCASCGYLNHISTFQCLDFMFVWVLLYLSSSGADFSWFWLLVSMRKSNGLCFCLSRSPKKKGTREWAELSFISSFATIFLSFEGICVWMSRVLPFGDQQVRARRKHWWLEINLCLLLALREVCCEKRDDLDTGQQGWEKSDYAHIFSKKKPKLYNPQKESIYWKWSSFLIACMHWASFFTSACEYWGWWMWLCLFSE